MNTQDAIAEHTQRFLDLITTPPNRPAPTGRTESMWQKDLPEGWASLAFFPVPYSDESNEYVGPVLAEDDKTITLEIHRRPMAFFKKHVIITKAG